MDVRSEDERLHRAIQSLEHWLDSLDEDSVEFASLDEDSLWEIGSLLRDRAPEVEILRAVRTARDSGWPWAPIALLIGTTEKDLKRRTTCVNGTVDAQR